MYRKFMLWYQDDQKNLIIKSLLATLAAVAIFILAILILKGLS